MTTPFCIVGTSMGGAVVALFSAKYPQYASMVCLMAPPRMFIVLLYIYMYLCNI